MELSKKLTILVNTCDKYADLWEPFFQLFDAFAGDLKECKIYLNTESKKFKYKNLHIVTENNYKKDIPWGQRLKESLSKIETEYVLFLLDDFFLQKPINSDVFKKCIGWMDTNLNVGAFNLIPIEAANEQSEKYPDFCYMPIDMEYRCNAQACIWRKEVLDKSIMEIESPWDWEVLGNERNKIILRDVEMYALKFGTSCPYDYNFINYNKSTQNHIEVCSAIMRGKWAVDVVSDCFQKNNIKVNYYLRGVYKPDNKFVNFIKNITLPLRMLFNINQIRDKKEQYNRCLLEKRRKLVEDPIRNINDRN